jgi:uncharacterized protein YndB with AHSA1/START domain
LLLAPIARSRSPSRSNSEIGNLLVAFQNGNAQYATQELSMTDTVSDRIEKKINLSAPLSRVWRAISDAREFGEWFKVKLESPFAPGATVYGQVTYEGYEHLKVELKIVDMIPERYFAYRWRPNAIDPNKDYSAEPMTLVEFTLEPAPGGTSLTIVESGFDGVPLERRAEAFRGNDSGWTAQLANIERYVAQ